MLKAVILDFDGLIIDTELVWYEIFKEWFMDNLEYELSVEEFLVCVGANSEVLFKSTEEKINKKIDRSKFAEDTQLMFIEKTKSLPCKEGVERLIKDTKKNGLKLALATSSGLEKPTYHLKRLGIYDYFDHLITGDCVERIKPAPDLFIKALEKLDVAKEEAIIFEDSLNGLRAGIEAGVRVIVVPNEITKFSNFNDYYMKVDSLAHIDVEELIEKY